MKLNKFMIILLEVISVIISPFLGFTYSICMYYKNKDKYRNIIYISIFMGFFGMTYIPYKTYDITRHYERFINISENSSIQRSVDFSYELDLFFLFLSKITKNYQVIGYLSAFLLYYIFFWMISDYRKKYGFTKNILIYICLFFSLTPMYSFNGIRNINAILLFSLGVYLWEFYGFKIKSLVCFLISVLFHYSFIPIIIIYFLSKKIKINEKKLNFLFFLSILGILFSKQILYKIVIFFKLFGGNFGELVSYKLEFYLLDSFRNQTASIYIFVGEVVLLFFLLLFISINGYTERKEIMNIKKFITLYLLLISTLFYSLSIFGRYFGNIYVLIIIIFIFYDKRKKNFFTYFLEKIIFLLVIINLAILIRLEYKTFNSKIFYKNIFQLKEIRIGEEDYLEALNYKIRKTNKYC